MNVHFEGYSNWKPLLIKWLPVLLLGLYAAYWLIGFIGEGLPISFDAHSYVTRSWLVSQAIEAGTYPGWTNYWYGGYRLLEFQGPAYYWITGFLGFVTGDTLESSKYFLWCVQVASVLVFFFFLRYLLKSSFAALFGAVLFLKSSLFSWILGHVGNYPTSIIILCLPLLLLHFAKEADKADRPLALYSGQALILSLMIGVHLSTTIQLLPSIFTFELLYLLLAGPKRIYLRKAILALCAAVITAGVLTAYIGIPLLIHLDQLSLILALLEPIKTVFNFEPLFIMAGIHKFSWDFVFICSQGTFLFAMAFVSSLAALYKKDGLGLSLAGGFLVAIVSVLVVGDRCVLAVTFFLCALCAYGLSRIIQAANAGIGSKLIILATLACVIFFWRGSGGSFVFPQYSPMDAFDVYRQIPDSHTRSRTFDLSKTAVSIDGIYGLSSISPYFCSRGIPFGAFPQGAPLSNNISLALAGAWNCDFGERSTIHSKDLLDILYLMHIEFLIDRKNEFKYYSILNHAEGSFLNKELYQLESASPVIFSTHLTSLPKEFVVKSSSLLDEVPLLSYIMEQWKHDPFSTVKIPDGAFRPLFRALEKDDWALIIDLVRDMGIDRKSSCADKLFGVGKVFQNPISERLQKNKGEFDVLHHSEGIQNVTIKIKSSLAGFLRISYTYAPDSIVSIDGKKVECIPDALGGAFIVPISEGIHTLTIEPPDMALRFYLTIAALLLSVILTIIWIRCSRARPNSDSFNR